MSKSNFLNTLKGASGKKPSKKQKPRSSKTPKESLSSQKEATRPASIPAISRPAVQQALATPAPAPQPAPSQSALGPNLGEVVSSELSKMVQDGNLAPELTRIFKEAREKDIETFEEKMDEIRSILDHSTNELTEIKAQKQAMEQQGVTQSAQFTQELQDKETALIQKQEQLEAQWKELSEAYKQLHTDISMISQDEIFKQGLVALMMERMKELIEPIQDDLSEKLSAEVQKIDVDAISKVAEAVAESQVGSAFENFDAVLEKVEEEMKKKIEERSEEILGQMLEVCETLLGDQLQQVDKKTIELLTDQLNSTLSREAVETQINNFLEATFGEANSDLVKLLQTAVDKLDLEAYTKNNLGRLFTLTVRQILQDFDPNEAHKERVGEALAGYNPKQAHYDAVTESLVRTSYNPRAIHEGRIDEMLQPLYDVIAQLAEQIEGYDMAKAVEGQLKPSVIELYDGSVFYKELAEKRAKEINDSATESETLLRTEISTFTKWLAEFKSKLAKQLTDNLDKAIIESAIKASFSAENQKSAELIKVGIGQGTTEFLNQNNSLEAILERFHQTLNSVFMSEGMIGEMSEAMKTFKTQLNNLESELEIVFKSNHEEILKQTGEMKKQEYEKYTNLAQQLQEQTNRAQQEAQRLKARNEQLEGLTATLETELSFVTELRTALKEERSLYQRAREELAEENRQAIVNMQEAFTKSEEAREARFQKQIDDMTKEREAERAELNQTIRHLLTVSEQMKEGLNFILKKTPKNNADINQGNSDDFLVIEEDLTTKRNPIPASNGPMPPPLPQRPNGKHQSLPTNFKGSQPRATSSTLLEAGIAAKLPNSHHQTEILDARDISDTAPAMLAVPSDQLSPVDLGPDLLASLQAEASGTQSKDPSALATSDGLVPTIKSDSGAISRVDLNAVGNSVYVENPADLMEPEEDKEK